MTGIRDRRRMMALVAVIITVCAPLDVLILGRLAWEPLAIRALWALQFALLSWKIPSIPRTRLGAVLGLAGVLSAAAWTGLTWLTGGSESPFFTWMVALPVFVGLLVPDTAGAVIASTLATLLGNLLVLAIEGGSLAAMAVWCSICGVNGVLGTLGALTFRRLREAEVAAARERERALEALGRSEHRRQHAERLAQVGRLAAGIAHEIGNPLSYVRANLDLLATGALDPSEHDVVLAESLHGIARIEQIAADLRTFSRAESGTLTPVELASAAEEALRLASGRLKSLSRISNRIPAGLSAMAHRRHLVQVLVNLLVNAADALEEHGVRPSSVELAAFEIDGVVSLLVDDNGPGLGPELAERIFEPFFTTKPDGKGTGLGLTLVREYVEADGGSIEAGRSPSGGARFTIRLSSALAGVAKAG